MTGIGDNAMTPAQKLVLSSAIAAEPTLADALMYGRDAEIAAWLNADRVSPSTFYVYRTAVPVQDIFDAITWANFTPQDVPDSSVIYGNRVGICRCKQENLQTMLLGAQGFLNPSKPNIRAGLQDALTALPSGAGGANKNAGSVAVAATLYRPATRAEALLATGTGTTASPGTMTFFGPVMLDEIGGLR